MLKNLLVQNINSHGPMDLFTYMKWCQTHPEYGYYRNKMHNHVLGINGDFTTSPEISPFFGESIAFWIITQWERMGRPKELHLVELGGGRGVLMERILMTLKNLTSFNAAYHVDFLEINVSFRQQQAKAVRPFATSSHYESLEFLRDLTQPVVVIANEFFDALPAQQYVYIRNQWYNIAVDIDELEQLRLTHIPYNGVPESLEVQPDVLTMVDQINYHINHFGGAALIIDYGYWEGEGDSIQAVYKHKYVDILEHPGEADLSVHVNFKNIALHCKNKGLDYAYQSQRQFLIEFGIQLRLEQVCLQVSQKDAIGLQAGVKRLIDPSSMGHLFKVLQIWKN